MITVEPFQFDADVRQNWPLKSDFYPRVGKRNCSP